MLCPPQSLETNVVVGDWSIFLRCAPLSLAAGQCTSPVHLYAHHGTSETITTPNHPYNYPRYEIIGLLYSDLFTVLIQQKFMYLLPLLPAFQNRKKASTFLRLSFTYQYAKFRSLIHPSIQNKRSVYKAMYRCVLITFTL